MCADVPLNHIKIKSNQMDVHIYTEIGGRRSPAVACWASDHWVASLSPLRGKFRH